MSRSTRTPAGRQAWLGSGGATADSDVARKRDPAPLRDPSKQTLYNSIGLSLTNSICTLAFGIVL